jgi:hypothetical protein
VQEEIRRQEEALQPQELCNDAWVKADINKVMRSQTSRKTYTSFSLITARGFPT